MLADQHGARQIDIEDVVPGAPLDLDRIAVPTANTDIVVKDVDAAESGNGRIDQRHAVFLFADIGNHAFGVEPFLAQKLTGLLQRGHAPVCQQQLCTLPRKKHCRRPTVADDVALPLPGARDYSNLSFQAHLASPVLFFGETISGSPWPVIPRVKHRSALDRSLHGSLRLVGGAADMAHYKVRPGRSSPLARAHAIALS